MAKRKSLNQSTLGSTVSRRATNGRFVTSQSDARLPKNHAETNRHSVSTEALAQSVTVTPGRRLTAEEAMARNKDIWRQTLDFLR